MFDEHKSIYLFFRKLVSSSTTQFRVAILNEKDIVQLIEHDLIF